MNGDNIFGLSCPKEYPKGYRHTHQEKPVSQDNRPYPPYLFILPLTVSIVTVEAHVK